MLLVANLVNTKWCKKPGKRLTPWHMGTHLRVLSESYPTNTNMTGFRWFSKISAFLCFAKSSLSMGRVKESSNSIKGSVSRKLAGVWPDQDLNLGPSATEAGALPIWAIRLDNSQQVQAGGRLHLNIHRQCKTKRTSATQSKKTSYEHFHSKMKRNNESFSSLLKSSLFHHPIITYQKLSNLYKIEGSKCLFKILLFGLGERLTDHVPSLFNQKVFSVTFSIKGRKWFLFLLHKWNA